MKLISALLLTPFLASALSLGKTSTVEPAQCEFPVPGDQPLCYCEDPANYILKDVNVTLSPNPPRPGEKLIIEGTGYFTEQIDEGATVFLQVKYGLITLIKQVADMCEQLPKIDIECPIEKGEMKIYKEVDIPARVPPGKYSVMADVNTVDKKKITCMQATVVFSRIGS